MGRTHTLGHFYQFTWKYAHKAVSKTSLIHCNILHVVFVPWFIILAKCTVLNVLFSKLLSDVVYAAQDPPIFTVTLKVELS